MIPVFYDAILIAHLDDRDGVSLVYEPDWVTRRAAFPLSLTMPLKGGPYAAERVLPWIANLLPEAHLTKLGLMLKVAPQDILGLLIGLGRDTAGAFSFGEPRRTGNHFRIVPDDAALERIIEDLPERPFLAGESGVSMSLAGVQDKLPVHVTPDGQIAIPLDGTPSTHILKPDIRRLAGSVQNEAMCMVLASLCGLSAAEVSTGRAGKRSYLLVTRYDRLLDANGIVRRIHQEDFCQLLGLLPGAKYQRTGLGARGDADLKAMFAILSDLVSPAERLNLLDGVVFNVLVGNSDSHAKNYSILIGASGTAKLAPLYDVMCAMVYRNVDQSLPQVIGTRTNPNEIHAEDWRMLAGTIGLSAATTLARVDELAAGVEANVSDAVEMINAMQAGGHDVLARSRHAIVKRCQRILRQI